jgi:hypothetical protein
MTFLTVILFNEALSRITSKRDFKAARFNATGEN